MKDIKCPECKTLISCKNVMMFDDKKIELIGIGYAIKCLKCNTTFIPDMRKSKRTTKKQMEVISKEFRNKIKKVNKK